MLEAILSGRSTGPALSLADAAAYLGWSRRTLTRAVERHGIPTIGTGRRARLEPKGLETLKAKERTRSAARMSVEPRIEPRRVIEPMPFGGNMSDSMRNHLRRRLAQINRRSPNEERMAVFSPAGPWKPSRAPFKKQSVGARHP